MFVLHIGLVFLLEGSVTDTLTDFSPQRNVHTRTDAADFGHSELVLAALCSWYFHIRRVVLQSLDASMSMYYVRYTTLTYLYVCILLCTMYGSSTPMIYIPIYYMYACSIQTYRHIKSIEYPPPFFPLPPFTMGIGQNAMFWNHGIALLRIGPLLRDE